MVAVMDTRYDSLGVDNSPGQEETITNLSFNAEDTNDQYLLSPFTIPASGTIFSFWKQCYMRSTTAPDTQVDNVQIFSDGSLDWGAGVIVQIGDENPLHSSVDQSGYDLADAQETMTNHTDITGVTSLFTFIVSATKSISISEAGSIINAVGETTNYIVLQLDVDSTASPGTKPIETITWQYDEI